MARGRMLNRSVSFSIKFNRLPDDSCRLLATWLIPHLDFRGVFYADADLVKGQVMPMRADLTLERIEHYLLAMEQAGLLVLFRFDERRWMFWPGFAHNQTLRAGKEKSDFPLPPADGQPKDMTTPNDSPPVGGPQSDNGQPADGPLAEVGRIREEKRREDITAPFGADASISDETQPPNYSDPTIAQTDVRRPGTTFDGFYGSVFAPPKNAGEQIVREWCLAQHIEDLSIEFVRMTGIVPKDGKRGDRGVYAADAADWLAAGYTVDDMKEAYAAAQGKFTITHLGALFRKVQELRAGQSAAIFDATTPAHEFVRLVNGYALRINGESFAGAQGREKAAELGIAWRE